MLRSFCITIRGNNIDFYAQLRSKIDLGTCRTPFVLSLFWQRKRHRLLRTTAFKVVGEHGAIVLSNSW